MYIPSQFKWEQKNEVFSFIQQYPFATIISVHDAVPIATHLPFLLEERDEKWYLIAHLSKGNPQWKDFENQEVLVIFQEPHAYISPTWYQNPENVPTWNYLAVHLYGKAKITENVADLIALLEKTMLTFDPNYVAGQWKELSEDYKQKLYKGLVGFEIEVSRIQAKEKLNQNKTAADRQGVITQLSASADTQAQAIAERMKDKMF